MGRVFVPNFYFAMVSRQLLNSTDIFVIGGGPAGLAGAIAARQQGFTVMVADGGKPPIDKVVVKRSCRMQLRRSKKLGVALTRRGFLFFARRALPQLWLVRGSGFSFRFLRSVTPPDRAASHHGGTCGRSGSRSAVAECSYGISGDEVRVGDGNIRASWISEQMALARGAPVGGS